MCECEWRDIESAPRDGSRIMVANKHGVWFAEWLDTYSSGAPARYWFGVMLNNHHIPAAFRYGQPTHWRPLPPPPTQEGCGHD